MKPSALVALSLIAVVSPALAEDAPDYATATFSGDWNGTRGDLWRSGIALDAGIRFDSLYNRGGARTGPDTVNHLDLKLRADLEKLLGWDSTVAYINTVTDGGSGINAHRTGSLMGVSNIEVPVSTTRLFHAWVQKSFLDDRVSVLAGIYPIDSEFFTVDSAATLLHPAYGTPADLALTNAPSVFNNAAFGIRAKWLSEDRTRYGMGALLDGIPNDPDHPKRTAIRFDDGDGVFAIGEIGWTPLDAGHSFEPVDPADVRQTPELVAHEKYGGISKYAIGFWRYGNKRPDPFATTNPRQRRSEGAYVLAERSLFSLGGEAGRDVTAFGRHAASAGDATAIDRMSNLGVRVRGPLAARPDDSLAIGWTRGRLAANWRSAQRAAGIAPANNEDALEVTWRIALTPWLALQPDVQYIRNPGGTRDVSNARLIGARLDISL